MAVSVPAAEESSGESRKIGVMDIASTVIILMAVLAIVIVLVVALVSAKATPTVSVEPDNCYADTLCVAADKDYAPYSFIDENGSRSGYEVELITHVANRLKMNLDITLTDSAEMMRMASEGTVQIMLASELDCVGRDADSYLISSIPTVSDEIVAFAVATTTTTNLHGKRLAIIADGNAYETLIDMGLADECTFYASSRLAMQAVEDGFADFAVMRYEVGRKLVDDMGLRDVQGIVSLVSSNICIGIESQNIDLTKAINDVLIDMMDDGTIERMNEKWLDGFTPSQSYVAVFRNSRHLVAAIVAFCLLVIVSTVLHRHNVKSRKKLQAVNMQLQEAQEQMAQAGRSRVNFIMYIAHDIRTQINAIIGNVERINRYRGDEEKMTKFLAKLESSSYHLLSIMNDSIEAGRLADGTLTLSRDAFNIKLLVLELGKTRGRIFESHNMGFTFALGEITHCDVIGDEARVRQCLSAIADMLLEYIPDGSTIAATFEEVGNTDTRADFRLAVTCADARLDLGTLAHIWEVQPQDGDMRSRNSYSLAAAMSKSIIELMGGMVVVRTAADGGISCAIDIPLDIDLAQSVDENEQVEIDLKDMRILVVDDNEMNLDIMRDILTDEGMTVQAVSNGEEVLKVFEHSPIGFYDVILMDVVMPKMNGLEVTRDIRRMGRSDAAQVPIIAMSACAQDEDIRLAREAGMNAFLAKPVDVTLLLRSIANYTKRAQERAGSR